VFTINNIKSNIIKDYVNGLTAKECAAKYSKGERTIYRYIKEAGIKTIVPIDKETLSLALNDYASNNLTAAECSLKYDISTTTLFRHLKNEKIDKNFTSTPRIYNRDYFENINTEEKAYWLGFIAADGSITRKCSNLDIGLQKLDKLHLEKFVTAIGGDIDIVKDKFVTCGFNQKTYPASRVCISSKKMCNDLIKHGLGPQKSLTFDFPDVPNYLLKHFIRGYFDGDGCITTRGKETNTGFQYYNISLIATESFLYKLMHHLKNIGITKISLRQQGKMFIWNKNGTNQIRLFLDYIYKDCNIYLERKYERYLEFCRLHSTLQKSEDY
jgi:hypothetical protein